MDYELYHDESRVAGYWHGILLVPITQKQALLGLLTEARLNSQYAGPLSLKGIRKSSGTSYECADAWICIGVAAMMSKVRLEIKQYVYLGRRLRGHKDYSLFKDVIGTKLILFRERDNLATMNYVTDLGEKVEITFRIGLKAGLHSLGSDDDSIRIQKMHFDGNEHYHRGIDRYRIVDRLQGLRDYCQISTRPDIIDERSGNHRKSIHQRIEDCELLQLIDLLVGSFRSILTGTVNPHHRNLVAPVRQIIQRQFAGLARMQHSRWHNSLWMGQSYIVNKKWQFESIQPQRRESIYQLGLPSLDAPSEQAGWNPVVSGT